MSASARSPAASAVVAELQSRHATEVRSYVRELWDGNDARATKSLATFWREWTPPPGSADEIPREYVFAGARRHVAAEQRGAGITLAESDADRETGADSKDPSARIAQRFRRLTAKQQEMVRLHLRHRFNLDEMAEITELPANTAAQLLHTALARLDGSGVDDAHAVQLALAGANGTQLAAESPETRNRVAGLRVTIEVTRQVLARGVDTFHSRHRQNRKRLPLWLGLALGAIALVVAAFVWLRAEPTDDGATDETAAHGQSSVAVRRTAGDPPPPETRPNGEPAGDAASRASSVHVRTAARGDEASGASTATAFASPTTAAETSAPNTAIATVPRAPDEARTRAPTALPQGKTEPVARVATPPQPHEQPQAFEPEATRLLADPVETAPIAALRRALSGGQWPARRDVRVGTLLASIPPHDAPPPATAPVLTAQIESSESPFNPGRQLVRVALRAREHPPVSRAPATVILLLDVSGSMDAPNRLPLVQAAVAGLLRRLKPEDRVGVVTYAGESRVLLPPATLRDEHTVRAAVDALAAKGRTNGGAGLREAFRLVASDPRATGERLVILCTDGDFNMGETSEAELGALIDRQRDAGVRLAIFGFGRGERIDARLEALAARARGGSGYVNTRTEAEQALVSQLDALFAPVAETLTATIEFDPVRVARFRTLGEDDELRPASAGEVTFASRQRVLPGETLSAIFEIEPAASARDEGSTGDGSALRVRATCFSAEGAGGAKTPYYGVWPAPLHAGAFAEASVDFRFAAATAAFAEALRSGLAEGAPRLDEIEGWARAAIADDAGGYRAELLALIEQARRSTR